MEKAIEDTMPYKGNKLEWRVRSLVWKLKVVPSLAGLPADEFLPIVREWHRRGRERTAVVSLEIVWGMFADWWDKARYRVGSRPIDHLLEEVKLEPLPGVDIGFRQVELLWLIGLCRKLQEFWWPAPFFLSVSMVSDLFKVSGKASHSWLKWLCQRQILRLHEKGSWRTGKASTYFYLLESCHGQA